MLINRTRPDLSPAQYEELARLAQSFYDNIPTGVRLVGDWAADDRSRTFALLETDDPALLERIQAPFAGLVDIETIPVTQVTGWGRRD
ncbi:hypothetical protein CKO31_05365 [Thiohalocapsa halophila]|uniref:DUF3303 domain-containing protein n=1 Tax=Thiohalocapsa halophila TaxID=69359 RepID=A0ABS1CE69_9GAMM|nr:DUF3303 family protein [Thiohalocapsa halophila]MBK1630180.1 hypothetical protein [Thiohalocapsa halophila]